MTFAAPIALLFFGLFGPVILFYLLKQRRRRVQVSTLLFWDKILRDEQTVTSITKLKKLLSLLLQLLFIALLTLALARPLISGKLTGTRRIVLFVDTSASMSVQEGNSSRFELAREKALGVIRGLSLEDTLMLVSVAAASDIVQPFTDSKRALREAVRNLACTHGETDFKTALKILTELPPDDRETCVYVVSDGAFDPVEIKPPPKTRFAYLPVGEQSDNVGISAFQVRPLPSSPRDFQIHIEITNQSEKEKKVPVELRIGGRLADAYEFAIPAGESITRDLRQFSAQGGEIEVALDTPDAFPLDNRAFATLPKPKPIKVRLVTEANLFLENALRTDDEVELEVVAPKQYAEGNPVEVTIFSGWTPPRTPPGNSIFVAQWPDDLGLVKRGVVEKPLFSEWERDHPINRHLALKNITIEKAAGVQPSPDFQKLASSFNDPLVLLRERPGQKTLITTFDTLSSDLPLRIAFPILMANAIRYLAGVESGDRWQNPGIGQILGPTELGKYLPEAKDNVETPAITSILAPEGVRYAWRSGETLVPVQKVGIYKGESTNGVSVPLFAANLASRTESKIKPSAQLPFRSETPLPEIKEGFRLGFEPWFFLIAVGLGLSAVEWGLFHRRVIE